MLSASKSHRQSSWLATVLTTDFCPSFNAYVYWLKEPVGWFVLASLASALAGIYVNPIGWTLAASIGIVTIVGILWPWIAIKAVDCQFHPQVTTVFEGDSAEAFLTVRNRLPVPIWGLSLEGFLDSQLEVDEKLPTISLAWIPPLCTVEYPIEMKPEFRGRYPQITPKIASSFPFGIWTARKNVTSYSSLTVWPRVYPISGAAPFSGRRRGETGEGHRAGGSAEPLGCRPYRIGDSPRHVHWRLSARNDSLIVVDRGAPEKPVIEVSIDLDTASVVRQLGQAAVRQQIAWVTRVAASILTNLTSTHTAFFFTIASGPSRNRSKSLSKSEFLDQLALVPPYGSVHDTTKDSNHSQPIRHDAHKRHSGAKIDILGHPEKSEFIIVRFVDCRAMSSLPHATRSIELDCTDSLPRILNRLWQELGYVAIPA